MLSWKALCARGNVGEEYSYLLGPDTYLLPTSSLQILYKLLPSLHTFGYVFAAKYLHWTVKPFEKSTLWFIWSFFTVVEIEDV